MVLAPWIVLGGNSGTIWTPELQPKIMSWILFDVSFPQKICSPTYLIQMTSNLAQCLRKFLLNLLNGQHPPSFSCSNNTNDSESENEQLQQIRTLVTSLLNRALNPTALIITHCCRPTWGASPCSCSAWKNHGPRKLPLTYPAPSKSSSPSTLWLLWGLDWPEWPGDTCRTAITAVNVKLQFWICLSVFLLINILC